MASSSSNENGNLMDEFEEAFQACLLALTKQEPNTGVNKEDIELEVQKTTNRFIDVARQMEAFFLRKRFLVSTLKPDILIKDENQDLRIEIQRKDTLLNKHYNRLEEWKACLSDIQKGPIVGDGGGAAGGGLGVSPGVMGGMGPNRAPGAVGLMPNMPMPGGPQMPGQLQLQQQRVLQMQMRMMGKMPK